MTTSMTFTRDILEAREALATAEVATGLESTSLVPLLERLSDLYEEQFLDVLWARVQQRIRLIHTNSLKGLISGV